MGKWESERSGFFSSPAKNRPVVKKSNCFICRHSLGEGHSSYSGGEGLFFLVPQKKGGGGNEIDVQYRQIFVKCYKLIFFEK